MFGDLFKRKPRPKGQRSETLPEENDGPPDASRPQGLCSRCNKQSSFHVLGSLPVTFGDAYTIERDGSHTPSAVEQVSALRCRNCGHCVVVVEEQWVGETPWHQGLEAGGVLTWRGVNWWPLPDTKLPADVPAPIAGVFAEAAKALAAGCPRASAVMARRTLEAITTNKGQTTGTLAQQLAGHPPRGPRRTRGRSRSRAAPSGTRSSPRCGSGRRTGPGDCRANLSSPPCGRSGQTYTSLRRAYPSRGPGRCVAGQHLPPRRARTATRAVAGF